MEEQRFDELAKTLARPVSRRQMVKVLVATTVGGWFVRSGTGKAFASSPCTPNSACAQFCTTIFGGDSANQSACASEATKCQGLCWKCGPEANPSHLTACPGGTLPGTSFPGHCANLQTSFQNCGACNHACASGQVCFKGACCTPKTCANYPGQCGSLSDTCGGTISCTCPSPQVCTSGTCCTPNCAGPNCGPDGCGGTCGSCALNIVCCNGSCCAADNEVCCNDTCVARGDLCSNTGGTVCCDPTTTCCNGSCVTTSTLCGSGGATCCSSGTVCQNGNCVACGDIGQPCCTGGTCPSIGTDCCNGICCGRAAPHCCNGACEECCSDTNCTGGVCCNGTCCASGICCNGTCCSSGTVCQNGSCVTCGDVGLPCCTGGTCPLVGAACCNGICCGRAAPYCCTGSCSSTRC